MPIPDTPKTVKRNFDQVIDRLNSHWDLQLPRLHGHVAEVVEKDGGLPRRIISRIRFLCFRPQLNLEGVLNDFEEEAKQFKSNWVFKPRQEPGTLPQLPKEKSRSFEERLGQPLRLTSGQREQLLCYLDKLLDGEYRLSCDSPVYERSSGKSPDKNNYEEKRGRSAARPTTPNAYLPAPLEALNLLESGAPNGSSTEALHNERKRSPPRDAMELTESPTKRRSREKTRQILITDSFRQVKNLSSAYDTVSTAENAKAKLTENPSQLHCQRSPPSLLNSQSRVQLDLPSFPLTAPATSFNSNRSVEPPDVFTPEAQGGTSSNETSFHSTDPQLCNSDSYPCTQSTADALNRSFYEATELMRVEDPPEPKFEVPYLSDLRAHGPFQEPTALFPSQFSFRKCYELLRISQTTGLRIEDLISNTRSCGDDYQELWASASILAANSASKLPERENAEAWKAAHETYQDHTKSRSVVFSGTLEWNKHGVPGLFHLQLQPLKLEESCRFHRAYGSDRFLSISMPLLARTYLPDHLKHRGEAIHASVAEWLAKCEHNIAGRKWRAFFIEEAKRKWKMRTRDISRSTREKTVNIRGFKIHLFAVDGIDFSNGKEPSPPGLTSSSHTKESIENFLNWHIPLGANRDSTDCKAFQRFSLGLSRTQPTVSLEPCEFVYIEHRRNSPDGQIMNDGCARISASLGRAIAAQLELEEVPSVFQARIAGAKGVWMVDHDELLSRTYPKQMGHRNFCIEVSESQLKIKPHPMEWRGAHITQRTFEVVSWSTMPRPASLNFQILAILHDRRVPTELLTKLLLADHSQYHEALFQAMNSRIRLREWIERNRTSLRGQEDISLVGEWPDEGDEQIILFLENGFMPEDCPHLLERIRMCLQKNLSQYVDKLQIRVPQSTYLYCIADPYSVLQPDEVHVGFSRTWIDPVTGLSTTIVDGIDVLVGRLPALLPSDIQRRKAVWRKELQHFTNVVVFPSTGNVCLADMLSGGDYDGDMSWLCWDKSIVESFENAEVPTDLPSEADCLLESKSRDMSTIFRDDSDQPSRVETEDFFRGCFHFNLYPPLLGTCTLEHEKVSYHEGSLSHKGAQKLAALSSYLVDSRKQGYFLSTQDWQTFRKSISPCVREKPAYKEKERAPTPKESNVIDFLKFWVAASATEKTLSEFHRMWPPKSNRQSDPTLTSLWRTTKQKASPELKKVLKQLQDDVEAIGEEWLEGMPKELKFKADGFNRMATPLHQKFSSIRPLHGEHELSARWAAEIGEASSHWHLLRASCLHDRFPGRKMCWYLAGQELCRIKINATGPSRAVLNDIYKTYKPDKKTAKRIVEQEEDEIEEIGDY